MLFWDAVRDRGLLYVTHGETVPPLALSVWPNHTSEGTVTSGRVLQQVLVWIPARCSYSTYLPRDLGGSSPGSPRLRTPPEHSLRQEFSRSEGEARKPSRTRVLRDVFSQSSTSIHNTTTGFPEARKVRREPTQNKSTVRPVTRNFWESVAAGIRITGKLLPLPSLIGRIDPTVRLQPW